MSFFERIGKGWELGLKSFGIINEDKRLLIFPFVSMVALLLVLSTFAGGVFASTGFDPDRIQAMDDTQRYLFLFTFYLVNYAVMVFFNMALIHSVIKKFEGEPVSVGAALGFSTSHLPAIVSWACLAATVGVILQMIEDKNEGIARIVSGILGMVWSLLTYFVVPVLAYENLGLFDAVKRSGALFKQTWGEQVGANFSLALMGFLLWILVALPLVLLLGMVHVAAAVIGGVLVAVLIACATSAAGTVFKAALYQYAKGAPVSGFEQGQLDQAFS